MFLFLKTFPCSFGETFFCCIFVVVKHERIMVTKNRTYRVSDSDEKKRYLICISRDECYPMSDKNGNFLFTKKEAIDNGVKYCEDFVLNNSEIGDKFEITVEENTDEWSVEDIENKN